MAVPAPDFWPPPTLLSTGVDTAVLPLYILGTTIAITDATSTTAGDVTTGSQTFAGVKNLLNGFRVNTGQTITSISTDTAMTDNSDSELSTQKAVKTYVDNHTIASGVTRIEVSPTQMSFIVGSVYAAELLNGTLILESPSATKEVYLAVDDTSGNLTITPMGDIFTTAKVQISNADSQALYVLGGVYNTGLITNTNTTDSSSAATGAITTLGGLGVAKRSHFAKRIGVADGTTNPQLTLSYEEPATNKADIKVDATGNLSIVTSGTATTLFSGATQLLGINSTSCQVYEKILAPKAVFTCDPPTSQLQLFTVTTGDECDFYIDAGAKTHINSVNAALVLDNTDDSSSSSTGGLQVLGGTGIAKKLWVADDIHGKTLNAASAVGPQLTLTYGGAVNMTASVTAGGVGIIHSSGNLTEFHASDSVVVLNAIDATDSTDGPFHSNGGISCAKSLYAGFGISGRTLQALYATAPQATIAYDVANYFTISVDSGGLTTLTSSGGTTSFPSTDLVRVASVTDATSSSDGSFHSAGGMSCTKSLYTGGDIHGRGLYALYSTTPQLTVGYDASNKFTVAVSSGGNATLDSSGNTTTFASTDLVRVANVTDSASSADGSFHSDGGMSCTKNFYSGQGIAGVNLASVGTTATNSVSLTNTSVSSTTFLTVDASKDLAITTDGVLKVNGSTISTLASSSSAASYNLDGALLGQAINIQLNKVGGVVTATFDAASANAVATDTIRLSAANLLPAGYRPAANEVQLVNVLEASANTLGLIFVNAAGSIVWWYLQASPGDFTNTLQCGWHRFTISWCTT